jgi:hypothetical protein
MTLEAKELTKKEAEALTNEAFDLERKIKATVGNVNTARWELANHLYEFQELQGWKYLDYESLVEWLAQPDIGLTRSEFDRATRMWRDLVVTKQLPPSKLKDVEPQKLIQTMPQVMSGKVKVEDAIEDAKTLSYSDVIEKYSAAAIASHGQEPDGSTSLDAGSEPEWVSCPTCGTRVREDALPPRVDATA